MVIYVAMLLQNTEMSEKKQGQEGRNSGKLGRRPKDACLSDKWSCGRANVFMWGKTMEN